MQKFPFLDLKKLHDSMDGELRDAIDRVLAHGKFINGPEVAEFETAWAAYCGAPAAAGVSNGTSSIHAILECIGVERGDEVVLPSHTFVATAEAVRLAGAIPVFADADPNTWLLDPAAAEAATSSRTRAILPVHLYGAPADMDEFDAIALPGNIALIEDAAQAHGATYKGKRAGSLGLAASFSFFPGKNLGALGDAGAVTSLDADLAAKIRLYVNHGRESKYEHMMMGTNYRLDTLQAALLLAKLPHLDEWTKRRREIAAAYIRILSGEPFASIPVRTQAIQHGCESAYHLFVITVPNRDAVQAALEKRGVGTGVHYPIPCHLQPSMKEFGAGAGSLPVTEKLADTVLSLPMCPTMTVDDVERICIILEGILEGEG